MSKDDSKSRGLDVLRESFSELDIPSPKAGSHGNSQLRRLWVGLAPAAPPPDWYAPLGLQRTATDEQIEERFEELGDAYDKYCKGNPEYNDMAKLEAPFVRLMSPEEAERFNKLLHPEKAGAIYTQFYTITKAYENLSMATTRGQNNRDWEKYLAQKVSRRALVGRAAGVAGVVVVAGAVWGVASAVDNAIDESQKKKALKVDTDLTDFPNLSAFFKGLTPGENGKLQLYVDTVNLAPLGEGMTIHATERETIGANSVSDTIIAGLQKYFADAGLDYIEVRAADGVHPANLYVEKARLYNLKKSGDQWKSTDDTTHVSDQRVFSADGIKRSMVLFNKNEVKDQPSIFVLEQGATTDQDVAGKLVDRTVGGFLYSLSGPDEYHKGDVPDPIKNQRHFRMLVNKTLGRKDPELSAAVNGEQRGRG